MRTNASRVVWLLAGLVVAMEVPYPLVHGRARDVLTIATVVTFATASAVHALVTRSWRVAGVLVAVFGAGGFAAEIAGVHTGVPFGDYRYTGGLGASIADVPAVIALAWVMMAWPAACVAARLAARRTTRIVLAAVALATWDVFLDPQMVQAHHWQWLGTDPHLPGIDDVPLSNFGGWLLVALVLMTILHVTTGTTRATDDRPAVALWVWTWLSSALAAVAFFHRPAVAGWGLVAMGAIGMPLLASMRTPVARR